MPDSREVDFADGWQKSSSLVPQLKCQIEAETATDIPSRALLLSLSRNGKLQEGDLMGKTQTWNSGTPRYHTRRFGVCKNSKVEEAAVGYTDERQREGGKRVKNRERDNTFNNDSNVVQDRTSKGWERAGGFRISGGGG